MSSIIHKKSSLNFLSIDFKVTSFFIRCYKDRAPKAFMFVVVLNSILIAGCVWICASDSEYLRRLFTIWAIHALSPRILRWKKYNVLTYNKCDWMLPNRWHGYLLVIKPNWQINQLTFWILLIYARTLVNNFAVV